MNPLTILAAIDAGITSYQRLMELLAEARASGVITPEEQQARLDQVADIRARVGLPPDTPG